MIASRARRRFWLRGWRWRWRWRQRRWRRTSGWVKKLWGTGPTRKRCWFFTRWGNGGRSVGHGGGEGGCNKFNDSNKCQCLSSSIVSTTAVNDEWGGNSWRTIYVYFKRRAQFRRIIITKLFNALKFLNHDNNCQTSMRTDTTKLFNTLI